MADKRFTVNIDLDNNELVNSRAENLPTASIVSNPLHVGRFLYDTTTGRLNYDTGSSIKVVAELDDIAGLLNFKGGYDVATDTPPIASGVGVLKGDFYVVTVPGTFLGTPLQIGDSIFANINNPTVITDWTVVQGNIVPASETIAGVIEIATQIETDAGTDDTKAITPLKLNAASFLGHKYVSASTAVGGGTPITFTHNLNNLSPVVSIKDATSGSIITLLVDNFTLTTFDVTKNGVSANVIVTAVG